MVHLRSASSSNGKINYVIQLDKEIGPASAGQWEDGGRLFYFLKKYLPRQWTLTFPCAVVVALMAEVNKPTEGPLGAHSPFRDGKTVKGGFRVCPPSL